MQENTGQKIKDSGRGTAEGTGLWRIGHRAHKNARLRRIKDTGHRAPEDTTQRTETRT
jgi:hypothetical protein